MPIVTPIVLHNIDQNIRNLTQHLQIRVLFVAFQQQPREVVGRGGLLGEQVPSDNVPVYAQDLYLLSVAVVLTVKARTLVLRERDSPLVLENTG